MARSHCEYDQLFSRGPFVSHRELIKQIKTSNHVKNLSRVVAKKTINGQEGSGFHHEIKKIIPDYPTEYNYY